MRITKISYWNIYREATYTSGDTVSYNIGIGSIKLSNASNEESQALGGSITGTEESVTLPGKPI